MKFLPIFYLSENSGTADIKVLFAIYIVFTVLCLGFFVGRLFLWLSKYRKENFISFIFWDDYRISCVLVTVTFLSVQLVSFLICLIYITYNFIK